MSRSRRFVSGLLMTYGYQALLVIVGLWLTPFYLGRIGQHDYGLWLLGTQLLNYLMLTDFGIVALLPLETAYATGRAGSVEKAHDLPEIVGQTVRIVLYQLPVVAIIAVAMWFTIPAEWQGLKGPLLIVLLAFIVAFPLRILPALLQGLQDLAFGKFIQILSWGLSTVATVLMVRAGWSLYALAVGWSISQVLTTPLYFQRLRTRYPEILPSRLPPMVWSAAKSQLGKGFWINVAQVAQLLMGNTDLLIIGKLLGPVAVVPYSCTGKLYGVLGNQVNILMQTAEPALCELKAGEMKARIFHVLVALSQGVLTFTGLIFVVVMVVNHWFVDWWVSERQYGGFTLTLVLLATMVVRHWTAITAYSVFCFGHQRRISLTNLSDGFVTAGASVLFVLMWGAVGAPIGSMVGACLVSLPFNFKKIADDVGVGVPSMIVAMVRGWIWRFALVVGVAAWVAMHWSPKNLPEAAAASISIAALYGLIMLPNVLRAPLGNYIRPMLNAFRAKYLALQLRFSS